MGLIVDNFAGGGGASTGIEMALGRPVDIAINHDPEAVAMHMANHPRARHYIEDVFEVDPIKATGGHTVDLAWFSPDCKHHSKAKGGKPRDSKIRGLAWVAVKWAQQVRPKIIMLENVEEFRQWGPLDEYDQPIRAQQGDIFDMFIGALREQGYRVDFRELWACDYGAPTTRKRFFLCARADGRPIVWPKKTHGIGLTPYRTAADCIDWSIPCRSIFDRKHPLAEKTMRRIAKGIVKYVLTNPNPYIVGDSAANLITYYGDTKPDDFRGAGIDQPVPTLSTANRHALVQCFLAKHYGGVVGTKLDTPLGTVTAVDHHSLVACSLMRQFGTSVGQAIDEPARTVMPDGAVRPSLVAAFLSKYYGQGIGQEIKDDPMQTVTTKDRFSLVLVRISGEDYLITDIGMRMLQPRELFLAQGFPPEYIINPDYNGKPFSKSAQVRMAGNSVCPPIAAAIVRANMPASETVAA